MATLEKAVNLSDFFPSLLLPVYLPLTSQFKCKQKSQITTQKSEFPQQQKE